MLWDVVYNFFRTHVFSNTGYVGTLINFEEETMFDAQLGYIYFGNQSLAIYDNNEGALITGLSMPLGHYLSLIATIISMVVIVVLACLFIKKIYNMCAHIIA